MLKDRLLSSAIVLAVVVGLLWLDARYPVAGVGGIWLLPLLLLFAIGTADDIVRLFRGANQNTARWIPLIATGIIPLFAALPYLWEVFGSGYPDDCPVGRVGWIAVGAFAAIALTLLGEMANYGRGPSGASARIAQTIFIATYVGIAMAMLVVLRNLGDDDWGLAALITFIAVTKSCDAGAYASGRLLGRHKLIPRLSPGKTWEGSIGGIALSMGVAYACVHYLMPAMADATETPPPVWGPAVLGAVCAIAGMLGDLAESLIKRDAGAKDSGTLLPGLGGVWDVTDSLIAAAPPAFLCFAAGLAGA